MNLAIIGSKQFHNFKLIESVLEDFTPKIDVIISGGAPGADTLAKKFANKHKIKLLEFLPDFVKNGKDAKYIRDKLIVDNSDEIIAFYNGKCEGTKYTLKYAAKKKKNIRIVKF